MRQLYIRMPQKGNTNVSLFQSVFNPLASAAKPKGQPPGFPTASRWQTWRWSFMAYQGYVEANGSRSQERSFHFHCRLDNNWISLLSLGKVKSIGVSNFSQMKLEEILPTAEIIPAVDQVSHAVTYQRVSVNSVDWS